MPISRKEALVVGAIALCAFSQRAAATTYSITDLGTLGGSISFGRAINASGEVTGSSTTATGRQDAFLYSHGVTHDLGTLPGGTGSDGTGINDVGEVVGASYSSGSSVPFLYAAGKLTQLPNLGGYPSAATDINNQGQIIGISNTVGNQTTRSFIVTNGRITELPSLGGQQSFAYAINDAGQVAGDSDLALGGHDAYLYSGGMIKDLGAFPYSYTLAAAINDRGQIAGTSSDGRYQYAYLYDGKSLKKLGPGSALGLNDRGQVVGTSFDASNQSIAFVYDHGKMLDLDTLIAPSSGWRIENAYAINDAGQITGFGYDRGQGHAYLLTPQQNPVPEPGGWALMTIGVGLLGATTRRTREARSADRARGIARSVAKRRVAPGGCHGLGRGATRAA